MARRRPPVVHGILPIRKPLGVSSRAVVNRASRLLGERRCGHAGTLDPDASGVLVLAFGRATKVVRWLMDGHKTYIANVRFGATTLTDDAQGERLRVAPLPSPWDLASLDAAAQVGTGQIIAQVPPAVSALKQDGVRDYQRVLRGETISRLPRQVRLSSVRTISIDSEDVATFEVTCGPGFYVRAWARDLGERLDSAAHLCGLARTYASGFALDACLDLDDLEGLDLEARRALLVPLEAPLRRALPSVQVDGATAVALVDGKRPLAPAAAEPAEAALVLGPDERAVCVASLSASEDGLQMRVVRGLREDGAQQWRSPPASDGTSGGTPEDGPMTTFKP